MSSALSCPTDWILRYIKTTLFYGFWQLSSPFRNPLGVQMHLVRFLFLCISSASFDSHCDYLETANKITGKYEVIVDAQKSEISISADTDFDEMKKTVQKTESWQVCDRDEEHDGHN